MSKKYADMIIGLGHELADQRDKAHDLWTWLPSYKVAERHHNDYASEFAPTVADTLTEASLFLAYMRDVNKDVSKVPREFTPEELEWFTKCPCGEDHSEVSSNE
jgi:hypothetical protein